MKYVHIYTSVGIWLYLHFLPDQDKSPNQKTITLLWTTNQVKNQVISQVSCTWKHWYVTSSDVFWTMWHKDAYSLHAKHMSSKWITCFTVPEALWEKMTIDIFPYFVPMAIWQSRPRRSLTEETWSCLFWKSHKEYTLLIQCYLWHLLKNSSKHDQY